jgi:hypothetical protein
MGMKNRIVKMLPQKDGFAELVQNMLSLERQ